MERQEISGLVGCKVAVRLNTVEARGLEMVATLEEARDDGLILSEIGELGQGRLYSVPGSPCIGFGIVRRGSLRHTRNRKRGRRARSFSN